LHGRHRRSAAGAAPPVGPPWGVRAALPAGGRRAYESRPPPMQRSTSERAVVLLVAMVQFVNILDFMMVMPMGPDFAAALGIPLSRLGLIGGSYTFAAMVSGLAGSLFLDRFG